MLTSFHLPGTPRLFLFIPRPPMKMESGKGIFLEIKWITANKQGVNIRHIKAGAGAGV